MRAREKRSVPTFIVGVISFASRTTSTESRSVRLRVAIVAPAASLPANQSLVLQLSPQDVIPGDEINVEVQPQNPKRTQERTERDPRVTFFQAVKRVSGNSHPLREEDAGQVPAQAGATQALAQRGGRLSYTRVLARENPART